MMSVLHWLWANVGAGRNGAGGRRRFGYFTGQRVQRTEHVSCSHWASTLVAHTLSRSMSRPSHSLALSLSDLSDQPLSLSVKVALIFPRLSLIFSALQQLPACQYTCCCIKRQFSHAFPANFQYLKSLLPVMIVVVYHSLTFVAAGAADLL